MNSFSAQQSDAIAFVNAILFELEIAMADKCFMNCFRAEFLELESRAIVPERTDVDQKQFSARIQQADYFGNDVIELSKLEIIEDFAAKNKIVGLAGKILGDEICPAIFNSGIVAISFPGLLDGCIRDVHCNGLFGNGSHVMGPRSLPTSDFQYALSRVDEEAINLPKAMVVPLAPAAPGKPLPGDGVPMGDASLLIILACRVEGGKDVHDGPIVSGEYWIAQVGT